MFDRVSDWQAYLDGASRIETIHDFHRHTRTGHPLGNAEFINKLEMKLGRRLKPKPVGRPKDGE